MMDANPLVVLADKFKKINDNSDFSSAVALTRTAKLVQTEVKGEIKHQFTLRNNWTERGIRITPATPDKLESAIYSKDWYMPQQEEGADRTAKGGSFFIPATDFYRVTGLDPKKVISKKMRAGKIVNQRINGQRPYKGRFRSGAGYVGIRRADAGRGERKFDILYIEVKKPVHIRGRKFFFSAVDREYDRVFKNEYDKAWNEFILKGVV